MDEAASIRSRRPGHRPGACFGAASARPRSRKQSAARTALGGSVAARHDLIASGYRASAVAIDPPWPFEHYSDRAAHAVTDHYETMTSRRDQVLPLAELAAPDCALFIAGSFDWVSPGNGAHMIRPFVPKRC